jgi:hypothetical protein
MAKKTNAQKLETLVARTMKQRRGHKLSSYIKKDYGHVPDLSDQIWDGYRAGDVSVRTMFHVYSRASDPSSYDLDDLIRLANETVEAFPEGHVSEPTVRYRIWTDVPGECPATKLYLTKKIEADPSFADAVTARLDAFVEPARAAVVHTLATLGLAGEEASGDALREAVLTTLTDQWSVKLHPPHDSNWTEEQWTTALHEAALSDEVEIIDEFKLAEGLLESCALADVPRVLTRLTSFNWKNVRIFELVVDRGAPLRPLIEAALEPLAAAPDDARPEWGITTYKKPTPALYLCTSELALCHAEGVSPPDAVLPTLARFARLYSCNWFDASGTRRAHLAWMHGLFRLIPHDMLAEAVYGDGAAFGWDTVAALPSEDAAARAAAELSASTEDWTKQATSTSRRAGDAFALLGEYAGAALAPLVGQGDVAARGRVAMMLAENGHAASAAPLAQALLDSSKAVRHVASEGLAQMDAEAVMEPLADVLARGKKDARVAAALVLSKLSPHPRAHAIAKAHLSGKERASEVRSLLSSVKAK